MLQPLLPSLNCQRIILASTSPRRKLLLENIGLKFEVVKSRFEEDLEKDSFSTPLEYVKETAKQKTLDVAKSIYEAEANSPPSLIIGADTIVTKDNEIFEKPRDREHAISILSRLSGETHTVFTAVVLVTPKKDGLSSSAVEDRFSLTTFHEGTEVWMGHLTADVIQTYVDTGEPMDKAGGYGIQALGSTLIQGIKGDYFNVIGFPLHPFAKHVSQLFTSS